ncbi:hypothetical protein BASA81_002343 [Batrachochytrium salamandrivorans]|nr:hypothetical protein BASA81_002343 [Batrachochytrium salamandrivorans]
MSGSSPLPTRQEEDEEDEEVDRQFYNEEESEPYLRPVREEATKPAGRSRIGGGDFARDQEEWERSLMMRSGALGHSKREIDLQDSSKSRITVHASKPLFKTANSSKSAFFSQVGVVDVVRDRGSDFAKQAERGSQTLRDWKEATLKSKMRHKFWELGGSNMGKAIGHQGKAQYMGEEEEDGEEEPVAAPVEAPPSIVNQELPITKVLPDLLRAIRENAVLIVCGETGSGKTTRLPIALFNDGLMGSDMMVACTQPRRVAAMSVAKRVANECKQPCGQLVGYSIRFEDCTTKHTRVKYLTEGVLLRESLSDGDLSKYSVVVFDEAHERNLNIDVLFGLTKRIIRHRNDFRLVVTSATLDADRFSAYFGHCPIFRIPGRTFKVESYFSKTTMGDYVDAAVKQILQIHLTLPLPGDILVFMTGQDDITCTCELVAQKLGEVLLANDRDDESSAAQKRKLAKNQLLLLPMYSTLPQDLQSKIFEPARRGQRKCIVSTNIAETSLTVNGIKYVVDAGFTKTKVFNPRIGMDALRLVPVSQAAANQRSGRAGRTAAGYCYRLYTEVQFNEEMLVSAVPEIQRTNLGSVILLLKSLGVDNATDFDFLDPPPLENLLDSLNQLWILGAVDSGGALTKLGERMVDFPLDPALSKMLICAAQERCTGEIATVVSMLSVPEWLSHGRSATWCMENFIHSKAMRRAMEIRDQLVQVMQKSKIREVHAGPANTDWVRRCICASYFANSAVLKGVNSYVNLLNGVPCYLHPSSGLVGLGATPDYVVYHEMVITTREYMRHVTAVEAEWLAELGPLFFSLGGAPATAMVSVAPSTTATTTATTMATTTTTTTTATQEEASLAATKAARDKRNKRMKGGGWTV